MSIPDRLYGIAKGQLDRALERWSQIDAQAQREIDEFMASHVDNNNTSAWDRAVGKINAATAQKELLPASETVPDPPLPEPSVDALEASIAAERVATAKYAPTPPQPTLDAAYKMLGIAPGADWLSIQSTYKTLRERAAPERFPAGSAEQRAAQDIQRRVDGAFMLIRNAVAPDSDRFDRLEI